MAVHLWGHGEGFNAACGAPGSALWVSRLREDIDCAACSDHVNRILDTIPPGQALLVSGDALLAYRDGSAEVVVTQAEAARLALDEDPRLAGRPVQDALVAFIAWHDAWTVAPSREGDTHGQP